MIIVYGFDCWEGVTGLFWWRLPFFCVSIAGGLFGVVGWWGVWVLSVGGVCGWVFMSLIGGG